MIKFKTNNECFVAALMARRDSFKHSDAKIVVMGPRHVGKSGTRLNQCSWDLNAFTCTNYLHFVLNTGC